MDDASIQQIIAALDAAEPGEAPALRFSRVKPDPYVVVHANRAALLRIARTFLAAAIAPIDAEGRQRPAVVDQAVFQVHEAPEDLILGWIEQVAGLPTRAEIDSRRPPRTRKDRLAPGARPSRSWSCWFPASFPARRSCGWRGQPYGTGRIKAPAMDAVSHHPHSRCRVASKHAKLSWRCE